VVLQVFGMLLQKSNLKIFLNGELPKKMYPDRLFSSAGVNYLLQSHFSYPAGDTTRPYRSASGTKKSPRSCSFVSPIHIILCRKNYFPIASDQQTKVKPIENPGKE